MYVAKEDRPNSLWHVCYICGVKHYPVPKDAKMLNLVHNNYDNL